MNAPRMVAAAAAAFVAATLAGCSSGANASDGETDGPTGLAVVVGAHANQPRYGAAAIGALLDDAIAEGVTLTVVTDEGEPRVIASGTLADLPTNHGTRARVIRDFRADVEAAIDEAAATTEETNPLEAIAEAARSMRVVTGERNIAVATSMLQTSGALPMQHGILDADPVDVVEQLEGSRSLPHLSGYTVTLLALGESAPPQESLDEAARQRLEQLWLAILERAGATVVIGSAGAGLPPVEGLPAVTPVPIRIAVVEVGACRAELPDSRVGFVRNSAEFLDEAEAMAVIADVAQDLENCPGTVTITGTTSSAGTPEARADTSTARAQAVARLLAEASGRPLDEFDVRGLGFDTSDEGGCIPDREGGQLVPELAAQNRKVVISVG